MQLFGVFCTIKWMSANASLDNDVGLFKGRRCTFAISPPECRFSGFSEPFARRQHSQAFVSKFRFRLRDLFGFCWKIASKLCCSKFTKLIAWVWFCGWLTAPAPPAQMTSWSSVPSLLEVKIRPFLLFFCANFHRPLLDPVNGQTNTANTGNEFRVQATVLLGWDKYTVHGGTRCCDHRAEEMGERRGKYHHLWREAPAVGDHLVEVLKVMIIYI